jgi:hypothetical protein
MDFSTVEDASGMLPQTLVHQSPSDICLISEEWRCPGQIVYTQCSYSENIHTLVSDNNLRHSISFCLSAGDFKYIQLSAISPPGATTQNGNEYELED